MARFDLDSVSFAQKPKSAGDAGQRRWFRNRVESSLTNLDVTPGIQKHVVTLDITVDDALRVQVLQSLTSLYRNIVSISLHFADALVP